MAPDWLSAVQRKWFPHGVQLGVAMAAGEPTSKIVTANARDEVLMRLILVITCLRVANTGADSYI